MTHMLADVRYALRTLRKSPVFTSVAVISIALGLGANTAIFTLVDQALLRLLPVKDPQQLVLLHGRGGWHGNSQGDQYVLTYPIYEALRDRNEVFSSVFARRNYAMQVAVQGRTERVPGELVSGNYFSVLGVGAALGRVITAEDDKTPGEHPVAVISHSYWQARFGGDPNVIGTKIIVNDTPLTIIGVSQRGFDGIDKGEVSQLRVPLMMTAAIAKTIGGDPPALQEHGLRWLHVFARLRPDLTIEQAQARLQPSYHSLLVEETKQVRFADVPAEVATSFLKGTIELVPAAQGHPNFSRNLAKPLWVLMAIVVGLLLIACANVANLLLARGTARQREIALRLALGASRARIMQQLLVESLLIAITGSAMGLLLATWGASLLLGFVVNPDQSVTLSARPDLRMAGFNVLIAMVTGLLFGLAPALQATHPELAPTLKEQASSVPGGGQVRLRKALVVSQVALSLLLLIGAGLFVRSLRNLLTLDPGFKTTNLVSFGIDPRLNGYRPEQTKVLYKMLLQRLNATPGVESASLAVVPLLGGNQWVSSMAVEGYRRKPGEDMSTWTNVVTPDFFKTMGIPLIAGRDFRDTDLRTRKAEEQDPRLQVDGFRVVIANESFVKRYFGNRNPIGLHVGWGATGNEPTPMEIVGVVKDAKYTGIRDDTPQQLYFPVFEYDRAGGVTAYVRTTNPPQTMFNLVRQTMTQLDANLPVFAMKTVDDQLNRSLANDRLMASLSSIFSVLATLLAMIGLYGVMAYTVSRRTREIGIRIALGALSGRIAWLVMREVLMLVGIGMVIAVPAVWAASTYVRSQLYGVTPADPATLVIASLALAAVAALAGLVPALRAARVNPITALRYE
jgi:predicted permease